MEKICLECGDTKDIGEFYKHKQMLDGHLNKCKECVKKRIRKREERLKAADPEWNFREKERHRLKQRRYRDNGLVPHPHGKEKYPYKKMACTKVKRVPCPDGSQRHHWSYQEEHWADIFILTKDEHLSVHRYTIFDPERRMYRRVDGILLDSREKAEQYYRVVFNTKDGEYPKF